MTESFSQTEDTDIASMSSSNPPIRESGRLDSTKLMRRINELEAEKLNGERELLGLKLTMQSLKKEKESLNDQLMSLQGKFPTAQATDNGKIRLQKRIFLMEKFNSQTQRELQNLKSCIAAVKGEKESLRQRILDLEELLEEVKEKNEVYLNDKEEGRSRVEEANRWVESLREWKNKTVSDMEVTKSNVQKFPSMIKENASHLQTMRSQYKKMYKKLKKAIVILKMANETELTLQHEKIGLSSQIERMKTDLEERTSEMENSHMDLFESKEMAAALRKKLENVAESNLNNNKQSNDVIKSLENKLANLKLRTENLDDDHREEVAEMERVIDSERKIVNFMVISHKCLGEDFDTLYESTSYLRRAIEAVTRGTRFVSEI